jgi:hypothetical protein
MENVPQGDKSDEDYSADYRNEAYKFGDERPIWSGKIKRPESWVDEKIRARIVEALRHVLLDLLRPIYVRDVPFNLFGRFDEDLDNRPRGREASRSPLAGWGVPVEVMRKQIRESRVADGKDGDR